MDSPQPLEVMSMQWIIPSLIGLGIFLLCQLGALIWFLSAVKRDLCYIRKTLDHEEGRVKDQEERLDGVAKRVTTMEATCEATHKRKRW